jgi:hypothetical protein
MLMRYIFLTNENIYKVGMSTKENHKRFNQYPAIGRILDPNTFAPRLSKSTTSVKDVYLK